MTDDPVVIVGAGIVGASLSYHLRTSARPVLVFEKNEPGSGTTAASAGHFTHHQVPPTRDTYRRRRLAWEWYDDRIAAGELAFDPVGTVHLADQPSTADDLRSAAESLRTYGIECEFLSADALRDRGLDGPSVAGGLWLGSDGVLDPGAVVDYLLSSARREGVTVESGIAVTDVQVEGETVTGVATTDRVQPASTVVNAAGPWAGRVNDMAGVAAPLRHTIGPIVELEYDRSGAIPLTLLPDGHYARYSPEFDDGLLVGAFDTDYEGAAVHDPDETRFDGELSRAQASRAVGSLVAEGDLGEIRDRYLGLRTVTPDGAPIVDHTAVDGFVLACGMSGYGVTEAPALGALLAEWLVRGERPDDLAPLSSGRF